MKNIKNSVMKLAGRGLLSLVALFTVVNLNSTFWAHSEKLPKSMSR